MARLSHAQAKATTQFTIHQDAEPEHADIPRSPQKSRRKEVPRPESNGDDGVLATELSSLRLSDHPIRKKTIKTAESSSESTVAGKKQKGRARPLGSAKKNPLLVSLSSSSESGDRYSLENVENFRPKDESWGELPSVSKDISKRSPKKAAPNPSTLLNKNDEAETEVPIGPDAADDEDDAAGTSDDGFDSLEDFIVDDDADISYCEDSDAIVEDEEEVVVKPKSPKRRLFRGVRRNAVDYPSSNSSSLSNHRTVNALGLDLADSDERFPAPFDLEPATSHTANDTTPVKKSSQSMMDGSGSSLAIQAKRSAPLPQQYRYHNSDLQIPALHCEKAPVLQLVRDASHHQPVHPSQRCCRRPNSRPGSQFHHINLAWMRSGALRLSMNGMTHIRQGRRLVYGVT
jgi:hypothetical protein